LLLTLSACGPATPVDAPGGKKVVGLPPQPVPTGPVLSGVGTLAQADLKTVVIDHEAVAGGLPAGRHSFRAQGDVVAEAPLEPGARVAFSYQDWKPAPVLTELKAR
jgi:hypothetical protein